MIITICKQDNHWEWKFYRIQYYSFIYYNFVVCFHTFWQCHKMTSWWKYYDQGYSWSNFSTFSRYDFGVSDVSICDILDVLRSNKRFDFNIYPLLVSHKLLVQNLERLPYDNYVRQSSMHRWCFRI